MIIINIDKIRQEAKARKKHKPKIRIILPEILKDANEQIDHQVAEKIGESAISQDKSQSLQEGLMWELDNQERDLRIERAKQSNKYLPMISAEAGQGELAAHYKLIESISAEMRDVYDNREFVRQIGTLPNHGSAKLSIDNSNILALKDQRRSLVNRRSKMKKKIELGKAKGSPGVVEWELKLDQMDAEFKVVLDRLNELRNE